VIRSAVVKILFAALTALSSVAFAQWIHLPVPGIPRTKDGKPDLSAPAPLMPDGKPDFSGIWKFVPRRNSGASSGPAVPSGTGNGGLKNYLPQGETIPFQPWAEALYKQRVANNGIGLPSEHCLPHSPPGAFMIPIPFKILQTSGQLAILFEEFDYYRQIFIDGRHHPETLTPTWFGYSVGKWDKDTLMVDTIGFNDRTWLDTSGYPHTQDLHLTERFTRRDFGHMEVLVTIDDPKAYERPWSPLLHFELQPDTELMEHVCENERDAGHLVGK
jgi:hypothetical protein